MRGDDHSSSPSRYLPSNLLHSSVLSVAGRGNVPLAVNRLAVNHVLTQATKQDLLDIRLKYWVPDYVLMRLSWRMRGSTPFRWGG